VRGIDGREFSASSLESLAVRPPRSLAVVHVHASFFNTSRQVELRDGYSQSYHSPHHSYHHVFNTDDVAIPTDRILYILCTNCKHTHRHLLTNELDTWVLAVTCYAVTTSMKTRGAALHIYSTVPAVPVHLYAVEPIKSSPPTRSLWCGTICVLPLRFICQYRYHCNLEQHR
jgi:hypothetical protein